MEKFLAPKTDCLTADPQNNRLLAALPDSDWQRWKPHLELVTMRHGATLCDAGEYPSHVYFPTTAMVSLQHFTRAGASAEIATIGSEGMVGVSVIMGGGTSLNTAVVCAAGHAFRISSARLQSEFHSSDGVKRLLLLYLQAMMTYTAQTAVCNRHHPLEQRLCRCLLTSLDRAYSPTMNLTHEGIASLLGVRREGVTAAAQKLQRAGVIEYARGRLSVLDREALEDQSCECYDVVKQEYKRLLPQASFLPKFLPTRAAPLEAPAGIPFPGGARLRESNRHAMAT